METAVPPFPPARGPSLPPAGSGRMPVWRYALRDRYAGGDGAYGGPGRAKIVPRLELSRCGSRFGLDEAAPADRGHSTAP